MSVLLVVLGLTVTWAWGRVAHLAPPSPSTPEPEVAALFAAWRPPATGQATMFRSLDGGASWQPLALPKGATPATWAADGGERVAVVAEDGSLLLSQDRGNTWVVSAVDFGILSMIWDTDGHLFLGTDGQGIRRVTASRGSVALTSAGEELASARVVGLAEADNRLFAATANALFYTDDDGTTWTKPSTGSRPSGPVPESVTTVAATDTQTVYVGTATTGVYRSSDAGQTWQPAWEGLGLAAGQMVKVTALRADPEERGILVAAVDHVVGGTTVQASAAGAFVTFDGGLSWQALAGPAFPEAQHASSLVLVPGGPLSVQVVTAEGLQSYAPDMAGMLAALESADPQVRSAAARELGLARAQGVCHELLAALDDPDPAVSIAAANALWRINDPAAVPGLLVALEHPREEVRLAAARAVGMMRVDTAVQPLRTMLLRGEGLEVSVAGEALGRIGGEAAIDALLVALADPSPTTRSVAAMAALEKLGEPAVGPLLKMLDNTDAHSRRNAARALGWVGLPSGTEALAQALKDKDPAVRTQAAWALGEIGDPAARAALERVLVGDPTAEVRTQAEWALSQLGEEPAVARAWPAAWAQAIRRFEAMRWLVLALSLAGAAWLAVGQGAFSAVALDQRPRRH